MEKKQIYPGFVYKLKATFTFNVLALTDSLFVIPGEPPSSVEDGEAYEISGNGISKKVTLHYQHRSLGEDILREYKCRANRINESLVYEIWSAT